MYLLDEYLSPRLGPKMNNAKLSLLRACQHQVRFLCKNPASGRSGGFSLVEVTLAIGIVAFAFVALFALIPVGLTTFRQAMDTSVGAQIVQRVVSDAEQTDFDLLVNGGLGGTTGGDTYYLLPLRYFDDQGNELLEADKAKGIYTVRTRGSQPGLADPKSHTTSFPTALPSLGGGKRFNPRDMTFLTIQIVNNPGNKSLADALQEPLPSVPADSIRLIDEKKARELALPVTTYSSIISRNGYSNPRPK